MKRENRSQKKSKHSIDRHERRTIFADQSDGSIDTRSLLGISKAEVESLEADTPEFADPNTTQRFGHSAEAVEESNGCSAKVASRLNCSAPPLHKESAIA